MEEYKINIRSQIESFCSNFYGANSCRFPVRIQLLKMKTVNEKERTCITQPNYTSCSHEIRTNICSFYPYKRAANKSAT